MSTETAPLLALEGLSVSFATPRGPVRAVEDVALTVASGECLGLVGESGAGKSQLFLAVLGLLGANGRTSGSARLFGRELLGLPERALERVRGASIGMVFQDPAGSLTPHLPVGAQLAEVLVRHEGLSRREARRRVPALLEQVHLDDPARRARAFPHELSGGQRQRVVIAIALAAQPKLLIADEPTTALDATVQAQILALLLEMKAARSLALVLISHDLNVVGALADRIAVLRTGRLIESAPAHSLLTRPRDPYTRELVRLAAATDGPPGAPDATKPAALTLEALTVRYPVGGRGMRTRELTALDAVSLTLRAGEALGLVGESGSGKSTLALAALALLKPAHGRVLWWSRATSQLPREALRRARRDVQIIFQDPVGSLDPRQKVLESVCEGLKVHEPALGEHARRELAAAALSRVALPQTLLGRYPHELSGGEAQRVAIARALVLTPRVLVCDEPLSALDLPTQRQIVAVLAELKRTQDLALLFISHDLAAVG
ncbi:MAG TPA: ATP-binding cassette domain-containing protein, partial [Steroidobacteraceae bacterium]|nr:ATP-binding cassette domain-containing protein [Steroidobacteraceae bacterium]